MCTPGRCWEARSSTAEDFFVDRRQSSHGRRLAKSLGVALKRAFMNSSELSVGSIRVFLFADVLADLLQFEPNGGHRITAGPEVLASEVSFLTPQASNRDGTLPLQETDHRSNRVLRGNRDAHVYVVRHQMPFDNLAFFLPCQRMENWSQLPTCLPEKRLASSLGHKHDVILAVPLGVG